MKAEDFFAAADAREPSRPKAVNPVTGKEQSWTRASNHAAPLDNPHGLIKHQTRALVRGLALRHDLLRVLLSGATLDDVSKVDEIIASALGTQELDAQANNGTAIHAALSRSWVHGISAVAEEFHKYVHAFAAALKEYGLRPIATEQTVLNTKRNVRGTFDWAFQEADGAEVIGDVKSGRLDVAKRKFAVQLLDYAESDYVLHDDGSASPTPFVLRKPYAVLVHIDPETAAVSLYKVDLLIGAYGAELAEKIKQWHTLDPLSPYSPPVQVGQRVHPDQPGSERVTQQAAAQHPELYRPDGGPIPAVPAPVETTQEMKARTSPLGGHALDQAIPAAIAAITEDDEEEHDPFPAASAPSSTESSPAQSGTEEYAKPVVPYDPDARFADLMASYDKAGLQMRLKKVNPQWTDLNHNRRWLARALLVLEQGWTDTKMITKFAAAKDDVTPTVDVVEPAPVDREESRRETALQAIAGAKSVGALAAFHGDFVTRHGDAAWTDELAEAARVRSTELDGVDKQAVLTRIMAATELHELSELWSEVTLGGSMKSLWEPFKVAGIEQMNVIKNRIPAADNPFGS